MCLFENFARQASDSLFAQDCLLCGQSGCKKILCHACADNLPRLPSSHCQCCALPIPSGNYCGRCLRHPPNYDRALVPFSYNFPLDRLIQSLKYGHRLALATFLGNELAILAKEENIDLVVPLPLHPSRLRERGFNQAQELARPVAQMLDKPLDAHTCQRIRPTFVQANLPWKERKKNMRNAFKCTHELFTGQRILLVDDVMTTGASLDECAHALKKHGAAEVIPLVVARALP